MAFEISAATADSATLTPAGADSMLIRGALGVMGLVGVTVGGGLLWLRSSDAADVMTLAVLSFLAVGTVLLALSWFGNFKPDLGVAAFVFDRRLEAVRVRGGTGPAGTAPEAYLAFADITGLDVVTISHTSSHNSGKRRRTTYTHHVVVRLRDGASWLLTSTHTREAAEAQRLQLAALLVPHPDLRPQLPAPELPPQLTRRTQGRTTSLRWRNPVTRTEVVGKLAATSAFGTALGFALVFARSQQAPGMVYAVLGFVAAVFLAVVAAVLRRLWQDATHHYGLEFSPEAVAYVEEVSATGRESHRERIARADWYGLSYSFDATAGNNEDVLLLTLAAHVQYLEQQQADSFNKGLDLLLQRNRSRTLRFKTLTPVQRLALVNWVRAEARGMIG